MSRQLFLHHYMPALYLTILLFAVGFDLVTIRLPNTYRTGAALAMILIAIYVFSTFSPITYGLSWTRGKCEQSKWLDTWDYDCYQFPESKAAKIPEVRAPDAPANPKDDYKLMEGKVGSVEGDVDAAETTVINDDTPVEADNINIETDER